MNSHNSREAVENGRSCICGDLHPWSAVVCHCGSLLVTVKARPQAAPKCVCQDSGDCIGCEAA